MTFVANYTTNIGRKAVNQDSIFVHTIGNQDEIGAFMVLCDGMGGLAHGEYASASVLQAFSGWFYDSLPSLLQNEPLLPETIQVQWESLLEAQHRSLLLYGSQNGEHIGTTVCALLLYGGRYYAFHVGDSRLYAISQTGIQHLTKDHSWVQNAVDQGLMTPEQARVDRRRNRLLQCVGAGPMPVAGFSYGKLHLGTVYLTCCDGFYHELPDEELQQLFAPFFDGCCAESIRLQLEQVVQTVLGRGETDNITAGAVYAGTSQQT